MFYKEIEKIGLILMIFNMIERKMTKNPFFNRISGILLIFIKFLNFY